MMAGRPLKFQSVEDLQGKIEIYFAETSKEEWTITGLALALDTSRETLCNYQAKEPYFDTIKKAKDMVEHSYEIDLKKSGRTGTIFALKNFDWKDKSEVEQKTDITSKGQAITGMVISQDNVDTIQNQESETTLGEPVLDR